MKRVYTFGDGKAEGNAEMRNLLGGKGANLAEMNLLGMPVPPGFTITTDVCTEYTQYGKDEVVKRLKDDVEKAIQHVEELTGKKFNDPANPLLVSVRSGARASHRNVALLFEASFYFKALRSLDILKVDTAESGGDSLYNL